MHNIHLGLARMLCDLFQERLMSKTMKTNVIVSRNGDAKKFYQIRTLVLRACNYLLSWCEKYSRETRLRLDFGKQKSQKGLDDFFTSYGVIGMLEEKDLNGIIQVMPFIAAVGDRFCGQQRACPTVTLFVLYVSIGFGILEVDPVGGSRGHRIHNFSEADVKRLAQDITRFKILALSLYQEFQASGMCTKKFDLLSHVPEDISRCGTLSIFDAAAFEASHKLSSDAFRATSRRRISATKKPVAVFARRQILFSGHDQPTAPDTGRNSSRTDSHTKYQAVQLARRTGVSTIVQKGDKINAFHILRVPVEVEERKPALNAGILRDEIQFDNNV